MRNRMHVPRQEPPVQTVVSIVYVTASKTFDGPAIYITQPDPRLSSLLSLSTATAKPSSLKLSSDSRRSSSPSKPTSSPLINLSAESPVSSRPAVITFSSFPSNSPPPNLVHSEYTSPPSDASAIPLISPSPPDTQVDPNASVALSLAAKAGIAIGVIFGVGLLSLVAFFLYCVFRSRSQHTSDPANSGNFESKRSLDAAPDNASSPADALFPTKKSPQPQQPPLIPPLSQNELANPFGNYAELLTRSKAPAQSNALTSPSSNSPGDARTTIVAANSSRNLSSNQSNTDPSRNLPSIPISDEISPTARSSAAIFGLLSSQSQQHLKPEIQNQSLSHQNQSPASDEHALKAVCTPTNDFNANENDNIEKPTDKDNAVGAVNEKFKGNTTYGNSSNNNGNSNIIPNQILPASSSSGNQVLEQTNQAFAVNAPRNVHRVQMDFLPTMNDELNLRSGQLVYLMHEYDDGWALCETMDRTEQGVVPRTCLSKLSLRPRRPGPVRINPINGGSGPASGAFSYPSPSPSLGNSTVSGTASSQPPPPENSSALLSSMPLSIAVNSPSQHNLNLGDNSTTINAPHLDLSSPLSPIQMEGNSPQEKEYLQTSGSNSDSTNFKVSTVIADAANDKTGIDPTAAQLQAINMPGGFLPVINHTPQTNAAMMIVGDSCLGEARGIYNTSGVGSNPMSRSQPGFDSSEFSNCQNLATNSSAGSTTILPQSHKRASSLGNVQQQFIPVSDTNLFVYQEKEQSGTTPVETKQQQGTAI